MAGNAAPFTQGMFVVLPTVFLLMSISLLRDPKQRSKGFATFVGSLFALTVGVTWIVQGFLGARNLADLHIHDITRITVGQYTTTNHKDITLIIQAIKIHQPYLINHEQGPSTPFQIDTVDKGRIVYFLKSKTLRKEEGVVVRLQPGGLIYSTELQQAFAQLGIDISGETVNN